jgi:hypothetical protein
MSPFSLSGSPFGLDPLAVQQAQQQEQTLQTLLQPTVLQSLNSPQGAQAKRQAVKKRLQSGGRLSTILTQPDDTLGA